MIKKLFFSGMMTWMLLLNVSSLACSNDDIEIEDDGWGNGSRKGKLSEEAKCPQEASIFEFLKPGFFSLLCSYSSEIRDAYFAATDSSIFKNPPLLFLIANAKIEEAIALLDFVGDHQINFDVNQFDAQKFSNPLILAVAKGRNYYDRNLLRMGKKKTDDNEDQKTQSKIEKKSAMEMLIKKLLQFPGINLNAANRDGNTALHFAYLQKDNDLIDLMVAFGADNQIKNSDGYRPLEMSSYSYPDACKKLEAQVGGRFFSLPKKF